MNKAIAIVVLMTPLLMNCSLIGAELGEEVDRSVHSDAESSSKYEALYFAKGLEWDLEIIKALLTRPPEESIYVVTQPCQGENTVQVCSVKKGCWCKALNPESVNQKI